MFLVWKAKYETSLDSELIRSFEMHHFFTMIPHLLHREHKTYLAHNHLIGLTEKKIVIRTILGT